MKNKLEPIKINLGQSIEAITSINKINNVVVMNAQGNFCFLEISNTKEITITPIIPNFPDDGFFESLHSHKEFVWHPLPGGLDILDINTTESETIHSQDICPSEIFIVNNEKKILFIKIHKTQFHSSSDLAKTSANLQYHLYDLKNKKEVYSSNPIDVRKKGYNISYYPFYNQLLNLKEYNNNKIKWELTDLFSKQKYKHIIIDELESLYINDIIKIDEENRKMLCESKKTGLFYILSWTINFKTIDSIVINIDKDFNFESVHSELSWIVGNFYQNSTVEDPLKEVALYQIKGIYKSGMSNIVRCGFVSHHSIGAFLDHDKLGLCYIIVENYGSENNTLLLYQLDENKISLN